MADIADPMTLDATPGAEKSPTNSPAAATSPPNVHDGAEGTHPEDSTVPEATSLISWRVYTDPRAVGMIIGTKHVHLNALKAKILADLQKHVHMEYINTEHPKYHKQKDRFKHGYWLITGPDQETLMRAKQDLKVKEKLWHERFGHL